MRPLSKFAPDWWDFTTLDRSVLDEAAHFTVDDLESLSRPGFQVVLYDTLEEFYLAEALEYVTAWMRATEDNPVGVCGPIGPTEQLPLVARLVNELSIDLQHAHFWAMDEWVVEGKEVSVDHPLSFRRANMELCFNRIRPELQMPDTNLHFPTVDLEAYIASWDQARCLVMQGGQGEVKHWAFNDPVKRTGAYQDAPPSPDEFRALGTRVVDLHPITLMQNARTSGGGMIQDVSSQALSVGPIETWKAEKISIWQAGCHDNALGMRLSAFMISHRLADSAVPMSLLADHPNVQFNYYRRGLGSCSVEMH
jgi:glucosamine-6-phosphate deaminase